MISPWFVFEVTPRCNAACPFCYNVWLGEGVRPPGELALPEIRRLFVKLAGEVLVRGVTLAGGEPLLRADLEEIISLLNGLGITTGLATNGRLLDRPRLRALLEAGVSHVEVSLPATGGEMYGVLTGRGSVQPVRQALLELGAVHVPYTVSCILTALNRGAVTEVIELAAAFGAAGVSLNRFVPGGRGRHNAATLMLDDSELSEELDAADGAAARAAIPVTCTIPVEPCRFPHDRGPHSCWPHLQFTACICGDGKWTIGPDGDLRTCEQNPERLGSLLERDFRELSALPAVAAFRDADADRALCVACADYPVCGGGCRFVRSG